MVLNCFRETAIQEENLVISPFFLVFCCFVGVFFKEGIRGYVFGTSQANKEPNKWLRFPVNSMLTHPPPKDGIPSPIEMQQM